MTDPKPTTNEQIALLRKWKRAPSNMMEGWIDPNGIELGWVESLPDFEHKWEHNGPLQDELWAAGFDLSHDTVDGTFYWYKINEYGTPLDDDRDETTDVKVATALDWLAWKKEGK